MKQSKDISKLLENISAISAVFHTDKRYAKFYEKYGDSFSGFPGIYHHVVTAAKQFTKAEELIPNVWIRHQWIESVDNFVDAIYEADDVLIEKKLLEAAKAAIKKS